MIMQFLYALVMIAEIFNIENSKAVKLGFLVLESAAVNKVYCHSDYNESLWIPRNNIFA